MSDKPATDRKPPVHPALEKLASSGHELSNSLSLRGYFGPSEGADRATLYPRLDDLTESFDIAQDDILGFEDAPDLPNGGKVVWLKKNATIIHRTVGSAESVVETRRGRLRIQMRLRRVADEPCQTFNCQACNSNCGINCASQCAERFRGRQLFRVRFR